MVLANYKTTKYLSKKIKGVYINHPICAPIEEFQNIKIQIYFHDFYFKIWKLINIPKNINNAINNIWLQYKYCTKWKGW